MTRIIEQDTPETLARVEELEREVERLQSVYRIACGVATAKENKAIASAERERRMREALGRCREAFVAMSGEKFFLVPKIDAALAPVPEMPPRVTPEPTDWADRIEVASEHIRALRRRGMKPLPPTRCAACATPIARRVGNGEWHPCADCAGILCEPCCESRKYKPADPTPETAGEDEPEQCDAWSRALSARCDLPKGHNGLHGSAGDAFAGPVESGPSPEVPSPLVGKKSGGSTCVAHSVPMPKPEGGK